MTVISIFILVF